MKCVNADIIKSGRLIVSGIEIRPGDFQTDLTECLPQALTERLDSLESQLKEVRQLALWAADAVEKSDSSLA